MFSRSSGYLSQTRFLSPDNLSLLVGNIPLYVTALVLLLIVGFACRYPTPRREIPVFYSGGRAIWITLSNLWEPEAVVRSLFRSRVPQDKGLQNKVNKDHL
jgi:hypothetical protein